MSALVAAALSAGAAEAQASCPDAGACIWAQQDFDGNRYSFGWDQPDASDWTRIGYRPLNPDYQPGRSAKNNFGARRILLATGFNGQGEALNVLAICAGAQDRAFTARYYVRVGATGSGNDC